MPFRPSDTNYTEEEIDYITDELRKVVNELILDKVIPDSNTIICLEDDSFILTHKEIYCASEPDNKRAIGLIFSPLQNSGIPLSTIVLTSLRALGFRKQD